MHRILRYAAIGLGRLSTPDYSDPFTTRIAQSVVGMQSRGQVALIRRAVREMPDGGAVLEIGSYAGLSSCLLAYFIRVHRRQHVLYGCDPWADEMDGVTGPLELEGWGAHILELYRQNVSFFSGARRPHAVRMDSTAFLRHWEERALVDDVFGCSVRLGGALAFVLIDGNHTYEYARADFSACDACLMPGGLMLLDDSNDWTGKAGVRRLMRELRASRTIGLRYDVVARSPNYLIRKRLRHV